MLNCTLSQGREVGTDDIWRYRTLMFNFEQTKHMQVTPLRPSELLVYKNRARPFDKLNFKMYCLTTPVRYA